jgi:hypothetical protein
MTADLSNGKAHVESPADAIYRMAGELDGVGRRSAGKAIEYDRGGVGFAASEAGRLSFRLRPEIVAAALRTPGTESSARGGEWVVLVSEAGDEFTLDRATAWFETAWRLAGESPDGAARPN